MRSLLLTLVALIGLAFTDKPAYLIYNQQLKASSYEELLRKASEADIVLFGELHNNSIDHWLQLELTKDLYKQKNEKLVLGAEMFESDNQIVLDEYLQNKITSQQLTAEAKVWNNYQTDYKPLVDFAQEKKIPFIATNIPRRYASIVAKRGTDELKQLSPEAQQHIAPQPIPFDLTLPGYAELIKMGGVHGSGSSISAENMAKAQAIKDATMSHFILKHWKKGQTFLHFNGSYHSQNFEGIYWYLKKANPALKIVTIATTEEANIEEPKDAKPELANFIITVPETMTKTH
ncbi:ChaN family lipoprotein [Siphonobacter sp. SORGH_AS_1065]|uniref:ChaN family lipoprotein n=1 Tax=Siphonobacter sp. SORGH_AS_1065 TaxID=3041795 RepID=UPI0027839DF3|nr:ChaN family lipoprotein [Siphonobacter sp. SORGH_AS_1065]MDQ1089579.1 putative iron-regulated protein [Siphonobacter sp. SORGH_AS_1065]